MFVDIEKDIAHAQATKALQGMKTKDLNTVKNT